MARTLQSDENLIQLQPKYKVGDEVTYINDYCVNWGARTITGMEQDKWGWNYYISPTDTPWCPVSEKNLHIPGTEPSFDIELNNGMVLTLVSTDDNANRYYKIDGKRVVLIDGKLHCVGGDWDEPGFPIDEQYQPRN